MLAALFGGPPFFSILASTFSEAVAPPLTSFMANDLVKIKEDSCVFTASSNPGKDIQPRLEV